MTCSGGSRNTACFSARLMWRTNGTGEMYTYLPPANETGFSANGKLCSLPDSDCNDTFGASIGRGNYTWTPGQWTTVAERVKLNDIGKANGELELFLNGTSVISVNGLVLRGTNQGRIRGLQMQTFFGGESFVIFRAQRSFSLACIARSYPGLGYPNRSRCLFF